MDSICAGANCELESFTTTDLDKNLCVKTVEIGLFFDKAMKFSAVALLIIAQICIEAGNAPDSVTLGLRNFARFCNYVRCALGILFVVGNCFKFYDCCRTAYRAFWMDIPSDKEGHSKKYLQDHRWAQAAAVVNNGAEAIVALADGCEGAVVSPYRLAELLCDANDDGLNELMDVFIWVKLARQSAKFVRFWGDRAGGIDGANAANGKKISGKEEPFSIQLEKGLIASIELALIIITVSGSVVTVWLTLPMGLVASTLQLRSEIRKLEKGIKTHEQLKGQAAQSAAAVAAAAQTAAQVAVTQANATSEDKLKQLQQKHATDMQALKDQLAQLNEAFEALPKDVKEAQDAARHTEAMLNNARAAHLAEMQKVTQRLAAYEGLDPIHDFVNMGQKVKEIQAKFPVRNE